MSPVNDNGSNEQSNNIIVFFADSQMKQLNSIIKQGIKFNATGCTTCKTKIYSKNASCSYWALKNHHISRYFIIVHVS